MKLVSCLLHATIFFASRCYTLDENSVSKLATGPAEQAEPELFTEPIDNSRSLRESHHTNNWAVLVSTSRFWFNYRHMSNVLAFYRTVKRLGIPDDHIIMMLPDDIACNPRNAFPGSVYKTHEHDLDLYGDNIEVDYRGYEVTVENFVRLLTDRWEDDIPRNKRLNTDDKSNILVYLTGHGGDDFLKFQDAEEIGAWDIADAFGQMYEKRRYNEILFMIDTCEANTMYSKFFSPNIIAVGSSQPGESSYANGTDHEIGVALVDRFSSHNLEFLEKVTKNSNLTLADLFATYDPEEIASRPGIRSDLYPFEFDRVRVTDFFANIQNVRVDNEPSTSHFVEAEFGQRHPPAVAPSRAVRLLREPAELFQGGRRPDTNSGFSWSPIIYLSILASIIYLSDKLSI